MNDSEYLIKLQSMYSVEEKIDYIKILSNPASFNEKLPNRTKMQLYCTLNSGIGSSVVI